MPGKPYIAVVGGMNMDITGSVTSSLIPGDSNPGKVTMTPGGVGRNIAEDVEGWSYSLEALVKEDPDYIIVRREDSAAFCSMKPYNRLTAVRSGHVIGIVSGTLDLQVPRNIDAILYLRKRMNNE